MYILPAVKSNSQISRGRGIGGLATLWKRSLTKYVSRVDCSSHRLLATKFSFPGGSVLVLNAYFPCDPQNVTFDDTELIELLVEIQLIIERSQCLHVVLAGDLNCHFERHNKFTNTIRSFLTNMNLVVDPQKQVPVHNFQRQFFMPFSQMKSS